MEIDRSKVKSQEDTNEEALMDKADARVDAEMKVIESKAKEQVADGLQDEKLAEEAEKLREQGEQELQKLDEADEAASNR